MAEDSADYLGRLFSTHNAMSITSKAIAVNQMSIPVPLPKIEGNGGKGIGMDSSCVGGSANLGQLSGQSVVSLDLMHWYAAQSFIGYQLCAIIAQQWLVNKACSQKGKDAVRNGFTVTVNDGSEIDEKVTAYIEDANRRFRLKENLVQAHRFNNVFGIRHVLFMVDSDDPDYYEKPFNPDGIKPGSYRGMSQIDPYWITPLMDEEGVANPMSPHFYDPTHWQVNGIKIHRSHFIVLRGEEVADVLKPTYRYGGIPLTQRIYERVYASERTANEAPQLAMTKRLNVRHVDLEKSLANPKLLAESNEFLTQQRDNYGVLYAGKDEEVNQLETSLTDLDVTIMTQYQLVAAIANVPSTKLLGTSPKGFNSTGEHEIETYHEELESIQDYELTPIVDRHLMCLMRSEINTEFEVDFVPHVVWSPLAVMSEKEEAEVREINSRTDMNLATTGAVTNAEIRDKWIADPKSGYNGIVSAGEPGGEESTPDFAALMAQIANVGQPDTFSMDSVGNDVLRQRKGLWFVYSENGKRLSRGYPRKEQAAKRLGQIEALKRNG